MRAVLRSAFPRLLFRPTAFRPPFAPWRPPIAVRPRPQVAIPAASEPQGLSTTALGYPAETAASALAAARRGGGLRSRPFAAAGSRWLVPIAPAARRSPATPRPSPTGRRPPATA